ncbi:YitT family protein [Fictibacillus sp. Mic-4]|uniref:YitT family protein n=1 Tax=Fictibacillus TaxID=1329200 RepID=UPI00040C5628|nr:YitT family protein [Fictibacillus gelatini]
MTEIKKIVVIIIGAALNAIALNLFLIPANVYASGFTGVSQLAAALLHNTSFTGMILFALNVPVAILGWFKVGKLFTIYSFFSVFMISVFLHFVPVKEISHDIILNAVFGGVIGAAGVGITLKYGASTGGLDIIALVLAKIFKRPIGIFFFLLNGAIIIAAGLLFGWEKALYTLVALYVSTRVIDAIHTRHVKLTAMIVTKKGKELKEAIHAKLVRGITIIPSRGAFSNEDQEMLMMVITRYELYDLEQIVKKVDPKAFTNVVTTTSVFGFFRDDD